MSISVMVKVISGVPSKVDSVQDETSELSSGILNQLLPTCERLLRGFRCPHYQTNVIRQRGDTQRIADRVHGSRIDDYAVESLGQSFHQSDKAVRPKELAWIAGFSACADRREVLLRSGHDDPIDFRFSPK